MRGFVVRVPARRGIAAAVVVAAVLALLVLSATGVLARVSAATTIANDAQLAAQRAAAERGVERGYEANVDQVRKVRALKLPLPAAQVDAIANKALADLATLRHSAFASLGGALGLPSDESERYATAAERRFDAAPVASAPSPSPVLLAPRLFQIVSRMDDLAGQISDKATRDLTASPSATPAPSPTVAPSPSPTVRPSPTPSPTR